MDEINKIDEKIAINKGKLNGLEDKKAILVKKIASLKEELENGNASSVKKNIETEENKLNTLQDQISDKNADINELVEKKDMIIKKCLMNLHSKMKKDYQKVNENHDRYVELYTQAREERHVIERKMMNLKSLVYKNYKVRLV
jgi:DNA repair exonuclease SbcCD ATPase subunit